MTSIRALVAGIAVCAAATAAADVWDVQTDNDNTSFTDNELIHGSMQIHDLGALAGPPVAHDEDWYLMGQPPFTSYEVVVDGVSGDLQAGKGMLVERLNSALVVLQSSQGVTSGLDYARSLRWENLDPTTPVLSEFVRVQSRGCDTDCGPDDQYRIRFYETTFAIPRFNTVGGQNTVVLIQNPTNYTVSGHIYFWDAVGTRLSTKDFTIAGKSLFSYVLSGEPALQNKSGTITISHNARYGDIVGKSVSVDPATGFSFDSPMVWRPR
jgi:hypothetical protein